MKKCFPILYISTDDGKTRFWKVWVDDTKVYTEYGVLGGKVIKSQPKSFPTFDKAVTSASAKHRKRLERGYCTNKNTKKRKCDVVLPMGSHKIEDHKNKIVYPAVVQRKLDGYRCMAHIVDGEAVLLSRTGKPYHHLENIREDIEKIKEMCKNEGIYLDGELYNHELLLRNLGSIVRKQHVNAEDMKRMKLIKMFVFDMFDVNDRDATFAERHERAVKVFAKYKFKYLELVKCYPVDNYEDIEKYYEQFISEGYEGVVLRMLNGKYEFNKRSHGVLRTKEFKKGEFRIVGAKEGTGSQKGAVVWQIECKDDKSKTFWGVPVGSIEERKKLYKNRAKYLGKDAIVKFWDIDKNGCIVRNPVVEKII